MTTTETRQDIITIPLQTARCADFADTPYLPTRLITCASYTLEEGLERMLTPALVPERSDLALDMRRLADERT
jgi:hypothetical protein